MKKRGVIIVFIFIALFFSCEKPWIINCNECSDEDPLEVYLEVKISVDYGMVTVTVYTGELEDNLVYNTYNSYSRIIYCKVPINKGYTLTAVYLDEGKTYYTVNSVTPRVLFEEEKCEEPCYYLYDYEVDLRLKFAD